MNVTPLANVFITEGLSQDTGGNQPFWVDASASIWFVESGSIDLFMMPVVDGGVGSRTHLIRVEPGQVIFGVNQGDGAPKVRFQGVGGGEARLYRLPCARFRELCEDEARSSFASEALDLWIQAVYKELSGCALPPDCFQLDSDCTVDLDPGECAQPVDRVIWVKHLKGRSRLAGLDELMIGADDGLVPLTPAVWLEALDWSTVSAADSPSEFRAGGIWSALPAFDARIRTWAELKMRQTLDREGTRLDAKSHSQRLILTSAVARLAEPLARRPKKVTALVEPGDPLSGACQLVCRALGIRMNPQTAAFSGGESKDALNRWARSARLRVRRVLLNGEWWRQDNGPMLGYVQATNRPVALLPTSATSYTLADPVDQSQQALTPELAQSLNPLAYSFYRSLPETAPSVWEVLQFGLQGTKSDQRMVLLLSLAAGLLGLAMPLATGLVFDAVIPSGYRPQLWFVAVALLVASLASVIFDVTRGIALLRVEAKSEIVIQGAVWDRLLSLPLPFFRAYPSGDLALRANGINAIQQILSAAVITSVLGGIFSFFSLALLFCYSVRLAAVASALVLLNMSVTLLVSWGSLRLQRPLYALHGRISGHVLQFITGISKLRVAAAELQAFAVWAKAFSDQKRIDLKMGALGNALTVFNESYPVLTSMCLFAVVAFGIDPGLTTGKFLAFNVAFMSFLYAGLSASGALISILHTVPIYERAKPILQALPEVTELKTDPGDLRGSLEVAHVSFRYKPESPPVLNDLSFQVSPGEFVALVGPSGSGKSTIMRLLLGFEAPQSGTIRYDGLELAGLDVQSVRRQIGVVLQNGKLIPGEIFENIVGSGLFTLDDAWDAARKAGLDEDIQEMPMGMHTVLGETAGTLSGGQRQRLMIARAIVAKPRILLFDEATSALDNRTQAIVSRSLKTLEATRIVIAHRLSTIMDADRILVLQHGKIVQAGTYAALIKQPGAFAEFARRQLA